MKRFFLAAFGVLQPQWAIAAAEPASTDSMLSIGYLLQTAASLAIVLAVIVGVFWVLRRLSVGQIGGSQHLKVVSGLMLGPKERVVVLEIDNTWLVVGLGAGPMTLLHSLPKPEGVDAAVPVTSFLERLKQARHQRKLEGGASAKSDVSH